VDSGESGAATLAHRPSRRHLIVDAAIRVFARKGFGEASIQEIADEAGMVATAVYYHFAGKEELFEAALATVTEASTAVVAAARPDEAPGDPNAFRNVMNSSWKWANSNPDMARLLFLHSAGGSTERARQLMHDYQERAVRRGYDYFVTDGDVSKRRRAAADYAARTLAVRTVIGLSMAIHPLHMEGGPLSSISDARIRAAAADICERIFRSA
jgi:AcrR family transcriptional regulator